MMLAGLLLSLLIGSSWSFRSEVSADILSGVQKSSRSVDELPHLAYPNVLKHFSPGEDEVAEEVAKPNDRGSWWWNPKKDVAEEVAKPEDSGSRWWSPKPGSSQKVTKAEDNAEKDAKPKDAAAWWNKVKPPQSPEEIINQGRVDKESWADYFKRMYIFFKELQQSPEYQENRGKYLKLLMGYVKKALMFLPESDMLSEKAWKFMEPALMWIRKFALFVFKLSQRLVAGVSMLPEGQLNPDEVLEVYPNFKVTKTVRLKAERLNLVAGKILDFVVHLVEDERYRDGIREDLVYMGSNEIRGAMKKFFTTPVPEERIQALLSQSDAESDEE